MPRRRPSSAASSLQPARLLALVVFSFFAVMPLLPIDVVNKPSLLAVTYWLLVVLALWLGFQWRGHALARVQAPAANHARAMRRTVVLGLAGVALLSFDRFVLRGAPLEWNVLEVREAIEGTSTGVIGMVAALLGSFAPFGFVLCVVTKATGNSVSLAWRSSAALGTVLYVALSVMQGSRSVLIVVVIVHLTTWMYVSRLSGQRTGVRTLCVGVAVLVVAALGSAAIMFDRLQQMGIDPVQSIQYSGYAESLQPSAAALRWIESHPEAAGMFAAAFSLCLYLYHGFFEFSQLFDQYASDHTLGAWIFWLPLKAISVLSGANLGVDIGKLSGVREGIFSTFVGPVYVDFGWFGPLVALLLGRVLAIPTTKLAAGRHLWLPASCTVCAVILMFPMFNLLDSAAGAYLLFASVIITQLGRSRKKQRVSRHVSLQGTTDAG